MKVTFFLSALSAALALAAPETQVVPNAIQPQACLPASCASFGCCSGNCGYWCRACKIKYTC